MRVLTIAFPEASRGSVFLEVSRLPRRGVIFGVWRGVGDRLFGDRMDRLLCRGVA